MLKQCCVSFVFSSLLRICCARRTFAMLLGWTFRCNRAVRRRDKMFIILFNRNQFHCRFVQIHITCFYQFFRIFNSHSILEFFVDSLYMFVCFLHPFSFCLSIFLQFVLAFFLQKWKQYWRVSGLISCYEINFELGKHTLVCFWCYQAFCFICFIFCRIMFMYFWTKFEKKNVLTLIHYVTNYLMVYIWYLDKTKRNITSIKRRANKHI